MDRSINEWIELIHRNAKEQGWWEKPRRPFCEQLALVNSEWSEALEEARRGRPGHYYDTKPEPCDSCLHSCDEPECRMSTCEWGQKPEGIAVELADGIIRILDIFGEYNVKADNGEMTLNDIADRTVTGSVSSSVFRLAWITCCAGMDEDRNVKCEPDARTCELLLKARSHVLGTMDEDGSVKCEPDARTCALLLEACSLALGTILAIGYKPENIVMEKHVYNIGRPYRHGKLF